MADTLNRGYPYPLPTADPDVPYWNQRLAEDVDTDVQGLYGGAWVGLSLTSPWVAYVGGGGYYQGLRVRDIGNAFELHGTVKSGAVGSIMAILPTTHRPSYTAQAFVNTSGGAGTLHVNNTTGEISYLSGPTTPSYMTVNVRIPKN
jgi:hypothetical protein